MRERVEVLHLGLIYYFDDLEIMECLLVSVTEHKGDLLLKFGLQHIDVVVLRHDVFGELQWLFAY